MRAALVLILLLTPACYTVSSHPFAPERLEREPGWTAVRGVPLVKQQEEMDCGAAAAAMVLAYWHHPAAEQTIWRAARPRAGHGLAALWLRDYLRRSGLTAYLVHGSLDDVGQELARGDPILVGVLKVSGKTGLTHYQVVVGLSASRTIVVLDPATGWRESRVEDFEKEWAATRHVMIAAHGVVR